MRIWLNLWRHPRAKPPYEVTVHASEEDAIEPIADDVEYQGGSYACTVLIEPASLDAPRRLDLSDAAHEAVEDRRIERDSAAIEARMLRMEAGGLVMNAHAEAPSA